MLGTNQTDSSFITEVCAPLFKQVLTDNKWLHRCLLIHELQLSLLPVFYHGSSSQSTFTFHNGRERTFNVKDMDLSIWSVCVWPVVLLYRDTPEAVPPYSLEQQTHAASKGRLSRPLLREGAGVLPSADSTTFASFHESGLTYFKSDLLHCSKFHRWVNVLLQNCK